MRIIKTIKFDTTNGLGVGYCIFISGCRNNCKGCFQPETHSFNVGRLYTKPVKQELLKEIDNQFYDRVTLLGGEPLEPENQPDLLDLIHEIKKLNKKIWLYSGCYYEDILKPEHRFNTKYLTEILSLIDVFIDGPFIESQKNLTLKFKGSENQHVYIMKNGKPINQIL